MKIVVTGGSGFIGTNLIEDLLDKNTDVVNIDIAQPKITERTRIWKKIDIRDFDKLKECIEEYEPDYIVHLAARTDLDGKSVKDYDSNTMGVANILNACKKIDTIKKIIITSSMLVCRTGYMPKNQFDYNPSTFYGESKIITEKNVWDNEPKCDWAIIRPTSIWGPWFGVPYKNFFEMVADKHYVHIGNKSCTKTYGYVGNAVYQIEKILWNDTNDRNNKVFYIGDYEPTNIEKWANEIADQLGYRILKVPYWAIWCAAKLGDLLKLFGIRFPMTSFRLKNMTTDNVVDMSNTEKLVGNCKYDCSRGIRMTLDWLLL